MIRLNDGKTFLWQWDVEQYLEIDKPAAQCHFRVNSQTALSVEVTEGRARIPDTLLQRATSLLCYTYDGEATIISFRFDVKPRPKPPDYIYTDNERATWAELDERITALEEGGGPGADGENGATFTPAVSDDGVISWTNDKGLENPSPVSIKGPKGELGEPGKPGEPGTDGITPTIGENGNWFLGDTDTGKPATNVIYFFDNPGVDLTTKFASEISKYSDPWAWIRARVRANNYTGIHIKDFIPFTTKNNITFHAEIAGIDTYHNYGDTAVPHHIDFICRELWPTLKQANPVNFNNGTTVSEHPWLACDLYFYLNSLAGQVPNSTDNTPLLKDVDYTTDGVYYQLPDELKAVIVEKRFLLEKRYTAGSKLSTSNGWAWANIGKLWVPTEAEVYGMPVWGGTGYPLGGSAVQYPLFQGNMNRVKLINGIRYGWWLLTPNVVNTTNWCRVTGTGYAYYNTASYDGVAAPICFRIC